MSEETLDTPADAPATRADIDRLLGAIGDLDELHQDVTDLRQALSWVREAVRNGDSAELLLFLIGRALDDGAARYANHRVRARLRRRTRTAVEVCGKAPYTSEEEAQQQVRNVWAWYGRRQRAYQCPTCRLWHLSSRDVRKDVFDAVIGDAQ